MEKIFKRAGLYLKYAAISAALAVTEGVVMAQDNLGEQLLTESNRQFVSLGTSLVAFLRTILLLGGLICLVVVVYDVIKGEREAAQKLGKWAAGLIIGFVGMQILLGFLR